MITKIKCILYIPISWILYLLYEKCPYKDRIQRDYLAYERVNNNAHYQIISEGETITFSMIYNKFMSYAEFRTQFYFRVGKYSKLIKWMFPRPQIELVFDVPRDKVGGGLYLQHGYCTDLSARAIGEDCWINQKVTLGYSGDGCPTLGNNVRIGVGSNIIGNVNIGNNVTIGAGTTVVKDVPDNTLVVGQASRYIKK